MGENQPIMTLINRAVLLVSAVGIIPYGTFPAASELEQSIASVGFEIHGTATLRFDQRSDTRYVLARFVAAKKIAAPTQEVARAVPDDVVDIIDQTIAPSTVSLWRDDVECSADLMGERADVVHAAPSSRR